MALYGLGTLERFAEVFDIEKFEQNKDWYFAKVLMKKKQTDYRDALELLKRQKIDLSKAQVMARKMQKDGFVHRGVILCLIAGKFIKKLVGK